MVNLSTWLQHDSSRWTAAAECVKHQELPWVAEVTPSPIDQQAMAKVCADCPVVFDCATYAINARNVGGFYAGLWVPWPHQGGDRGASLRNGRARRALRKSFQTTDS